MAQQDATVLLDEDHNAVMRLFEQYKAAHDDNRKRVLAQQICQELTVHMRIEDEIFYSAFRNATHDEELLQDATQEHDEARKLITKLQDTPTDAHLMLELEHAILHHVNDEREEMFPEARKSKNMDLMQLAQQLEARKAELMAAHPA
ncbi:hemerythrin domain-containing protein [Ramlibacter sp.]|uniref:hemerythrin domain-containing protein n=1 Tax=Ramlibacter sp. TaxID=1917967 RepID=UPI0017FE2C7D|nr:hemerythrin domain-containing protein [Ramlibacter sp.]MBA2672267.1 hemerythrin domain-containing protein [Ramlibacter sp.]